MNDQDKTKEQLVEELAKLREQIVDQQRINDNLPVLLAAAGFDGYYKQVNAAFERILGWTKEESLSRPFVEFIHPDDHAVAVKEFERLKAGGAAINFMDRNICKDGSHRWLNWIVIPVPNRDIVFGIGNDITERRLAEESLRQSEERYRQLADTTPDVIYILDETGKLLYANRVAGMYFNTSPESLVGKTQRDLFPPGMAASHMERIRSVFETGKMEEREVLYRFGDREVWLNVRTIPLRDKDGRVASLMGICRDVTEQNRAAQALQQAHDELEEKVKERTDALREANQRLQQSCDELETIYEAMVDGLLVTDVETQRFVRANGASCRMLGYSEKELQSLSVSDLHPSEVLPEIVANICLVTGTNDQTQPGSIPFIRKDGSRFYAEIVGKYLIFDGKPCSMAIFRDITERLQTQEALERERQSLWGMLQASDHERQIISYDIHDGLAQYLAAAGMEFQVYDSMRENSPGEAQKVYETAVELVRRAHAESRRLISEVRHPIIDERGLETAIMSLVYEQRQRGGPRIDCHTSVDFNRLSPILENALYRIVQEALTNACKHSRSDKVAVTMIQEKQDIRLEVQDWGMGFDNEAIGKGHFGLESIRQRTRLLGGRLTIESKPGSGTRVQAVVPILENQMEDH
ncbi:MAG: PAS domain S-box protein [Pirellulales bacterium]|nr:PAS domain S-box protein [Pirellulales bacterium]